MKILGQICTFNFEDTIERSVGALLAQTRPLDEILIVDNDSTDGTLDRTFPHRVRVIRHDENLGTSGASATALRYGIEHGDDWVWIFDGDSALSTRDAGNRVMNAIAQRVHGLTGGSADLAPSTKTLLRANADVGLEAAVDHNMHFGVREHAMGAIAGGMALHGGVIPYTATFLIFSDYMRPPMRLAALMEQRVIYVFTHDSVGLGEDGPTHQPVEQLLGLRGVPNLTVILPADATETAEAWKAAVARRDGPTVLVFTRQGLPVLDRTEYAPADGLQRGGYVLWEPPAGPQAILIATGSEVSIALEAAKLLEDRGVAARVVSLPSWELFDAQPAGYRESVLPRGVTARVSVEAATTLGWERYVGLDGASVGVDRFGASAPYKRIYEELGLTPEHVADEAEALVRRGRP